MLPIVREHLLQIQRRQENLALVRKREQLTRNQEPFELPEKRFIELFRLSKDLASILIQFVSHHVAERKVARGITVESIVLCSLRFYATGSYQRCLGEEFNFGIAQSTVHKYVHLITDILNEHFVPQKITFPISEEERDVLKNDFLRKWGFPGCIGAVDGTHVAILKPSIEEHNFINRKGYHSLNCQIICDTQLKIRSVFANFGGSTHDSFIWRNSTVNTYMNQLATNNERCWLVGDSGYPLLPYLMTPFLVPANNAERRYNEAHVQSRNCIERCFGVLKTRFRCLSRERTSRYKPEFVCKLVRVCAALHNMCIEGDIEFVEELQNPEGAMEDGPAYHAHNILAGQHMRNLIVTTYFQ